MSSSCRIERGSRRATSCSGRTATPWRTRSPSRAARDPSSTQARSRRAGPSPTRQAAQQEQRALRERAAAGNEPELSRDAVEVEEAARAAHEAARQLDVVDAVNYDEAPGRRQL